MTGPVRSVSQAFAILRLLADSSALDVRQVTQDRSIALKPRWSPDNRFISYTSFLKRYPDVYTIELATGARNRVAAYAGVNSGGAISPDGRSMALSSRATLTPRQAAAIFFVPSTWSILQPMFLSRELGTL